RGRQLHAGSAVVIADPAWHRRSHAPSPTGVGAPAPDGCAGSAVASQSTRPHTTSLHPPHPVVARVARATSSTLRAPSCQHATTSPLVTPLHVQTVVRSGMWVGDDAGAGACATGRSSRWAGSAGTGNRRVYVAVRSAPTSGAPTHVAPTSSPSATTTSTCRPPAGSLRVTERCAGSCVRRAPHTPIVTISSPAALTRTTSVPVVERAPGPAGAGPPPPAAPGAPTAAARRSPTGRATTFMARRNAMLGRSASPRRTRGRPGAVPVVAS